MNDQPATAQPTNSYVDEYTPPSVDDTQDTGTPVIAPLDDLPSATVSTDTAAQEYDDDEDLEAQNIFDMLGVSDGSEELKEKFLDQLQEVIWDDFLNNDAKLLLTTEELPEFEKLKANVDAAPEGETKERAKDKLVEYLEGLIPDLEDIMLEKALDLKADLFVERINGMKEYFVSDAAKLEQVRQAETHMFEDRWKSAAELLNTVQE